MTITVTSIVAAADSYMTPQNTTLTINAPASNGTMCYVAYIPLGVSYFDNEDYFYDVWLPLHNVPNVQDYQGIIGDVTLYSLQGFSALGVNTIIAWQVNIDADAQAYAVANGMQIITAAQLDDLWSGMRQAAMAYKSQSGVLSNDVDVNGLPLTAQLVSGPANGQVTLNADGTFSYTPNGGFCGTDTFSYSATDGLATSAPATVTIQVRSVPTAGDETYSAKMGQPFSAQILNFTSANNDGLFTALATRPANGQLSLYPDGNFSYTPNPGFTGTDSFTYCVTDGWGMFSAPATVTITFVSILARDDAYTDLLNQQLSVWTSNGVLVNDLGADYLYLTATLVSGTSHGTLSLYQAGNFEYQPDWGFVGTDTFTYTASDGINTSNVATVTITVEPVQANADVYVTPQDTTLTINTPNQSPMCYTIFTTPDFNNRYNLLLLLIEYPNIEECGWSEGDVTVAGLQACQANANWPINTVVAYQVNVTPDAQAYAAAQGMQIITAAQLSDVWNAMYQAALQHQGGVLSNDLAYYGNPLTAQLVSSPSNGQLTLNSDGTFSYTPNPGFCGQDTFTYTATDGTDTAVPATVTIYVNSIPLGKNDAYTTPAGQQLGADMLSDCSNADGIPPNPVLYSRTTNGQLSFEVNGYFTYQPNPGFVGTDSFTYCVLDAWGLYSGPYTITITVTGVLQANNDAYRSSPGKR